MSHQDGKHVIICWLRTLRGNTHDYAQEKLTSWPVTNAQKNGEGGRVRAELIEYHEEVLHGCFERRHLSLGKIFVEFPNNSSWSRLSGVRCGSKPFKSNRDVLTERPVIYKWQEPNEAKSGKVLILSWERGDIKVDEVAKDIEIVALRKGFGFFHFLIMSA